MSALFPAAIERREALLKRSEFPPLLEPEVLLTDLLFEAEEFFLFFVVEESSFEPPLLDDFVLGLKPSE